MTTAAAPFPKTRGHKKKERTRGRLVSAAIEVIAEQGEAFTVSDITARAGVANGTFYNYFTDRDDLIGAVVPAVLGGFATRSAAAVVDDDPAVRFAVITALALRRIEVEPTAARVVLRLSVPHRVLVADGVSQYLREDLLAGAAGGRFAIEVDGVTIDLVMGAILMATRRIVDGSHGDDYGPRMIERLLRLLGIPDDEAAAIAVEAVAVAADQIERS